MEHHMAILSLTLVLLYLHDVDTKDTPDDCQPGWEKFRSSCYYFVHFHNRFWDEAKGVCETSGAHLVSIEARAEFRFLARMITDIASREREPLGRELWWTSGRRRPRMSSWYWDDGSSGGQGRPFDIDLWYPGSPDNIEGMENFASLMHLNGTWGLNDVPHDFALKSICEYEIGCDTGWHEHNGNCYKLHLDDRRRWTGADVICQQEGARLVTIETASEFRWLADQLQESLEGSYISLSGRKFWTSGTQGWGDEVWFWDDGHGTGTPFDLDPELWYPGQPDQAGTNDVFSMTHISLLFDGAVWGLSDDSAEEALEFVCEQYDAYR